MKANGTLNAEYIESESEFSALSSIIGASAAGVRVYTATSSQGLALMHEVLFASAGLRLPLVMTVTNRALSAPLSIWNDHQDSISERDSGWIQIYVETNQEAVDTHIQAFRIAENSEVLLPIMVCMDGFFLTHTVEPIDVPEKKDVEKYIPKYVPKYATLDSKNPKSIGAFVYPQFYINAKYDNDVALKNSANEIKKANKDFEKAFGRRYGNGLIEEYKNDRKITIIAMGSVCGAIRDCIDIRKDTGLLRVRTFRPFPREDILENLSDKDTVLVLDKAVSLGNAGALFTEVRDALYSAKKRPKVVGFIAGLGGKDIRVNDINSMIDRAKKMNDGDIEWVE
ncbi:MAG: pyruvate ferredoxin oxidoreductase [Nanoarchaeota archaeon]|nr:pyruvate ferredoxin oxidoreductase [Nanoarchaeota archaeon]